MNNALSAFDILFAQGPAQDSIPTVTQLRPEDISAVSDMTFPFYRPHLEQYLKGETDDSVVLIALVARDGTTPVGLIIAQLHGSKEVQEGESAPEQFASLHSVFVVPAWRRRGVATLLTLSMEEELRKHGCDRLTTSYTTKLSAWQAFERVLAACCWSPPTAVMLMANANVCEIVKAPWLDATREAPQGFEMFEWTQLTDSERAQLKDEVANGLIPGSLSPFGDEEYIESSISVGVRHNGEVVGWMIVIRSPFVPNALCYRSQFVRPKLRTKHSLGPLLLAEALRSQAVSPNMAERPEAVFGISFEHSIKQVNFFRKRLAPYCYKIYENRTSEKKLG